MQPPSFACPRSVQLRSQLSGSGGQLSHSTKAPKEGPRPARTCPRGVQLESQLGSSGGQLSHLVHVGRRVAAQQRPGLGEGLRGKECVHLRRRVAAQQRPGKQRGCAWREGSCAACWAKEERRLQHRDGKCALLSGNTFTKATRVLTCPARLPLPHAWHTIPYQTTENGIIFASHLSGHASVTMRAVVMLASSINSSTSWLASFCGLGIRHTRAGREVIGRTQREAKEYFRIEAPMRWPHCMRA